MAKWVYLFGGDATEGEAGMRDLLGGKGANLAEMARIGLPVPPGFTITTGVCSHYYGHDGAWPDGLSDGVASGLGHIGGIAGSSFGDVENPLFVSVRSGGRVSMPGMMDTILNLGMNDRTVLGLASRSNNARFAYDSYRRFIQMYADVVMGVPHETFDALLQTRRAEAGAATDSDLTAGHLEALIDDYKRLIEEQMGESFPQDPEQQLWAAIAAVVESWMTPRAVTYRSLHDIPEEWGTAVNVQAMVFGNMGDDCATGVAFTRNPSSGEDLFFGEYLANAQGEDVVAGIRTPRHLTTQARKVHGSDLPSLEEVMPKVFGKLEHLRRVLEGHYREMQDIEFTVQQGRLWLLQTRTGKRTVAAALRIAVEMEAEGLIDRAQAVAMIEPASLDQMLHPQLDSAASRDVLARGLPASPGAASGRVFFSANEAESVASRGDPVILVRIETSPNDIHGMHAAKGILTARGGMTSHAAVVARGMGRPCVAGAGQLSIDYEGRVMSAGGRIVESGDTITIDGGTGEVMIGEMPTVEPALSGHFATVMGWADEIRRLGVLANADTPADARAARRFGAEGIGLCRTEHMFFETSRIVAMQGMILAEDASGRRAALETLLPMQRADFTDLFRIMKGLPVTIRLLDPPLNEFLPTGEAEIAEVARTLRVDLARVKERVARLHEINPMLGHRGCRLAITYPEICEMQTRAILEAAIEAAAETGEPVHPEIMIPLIATRREFEILKAVIDRVAGDIRDERGECPAYEVGTMIELPRAALRAGEIAKEAEFFSFGTNDLTQTTFGISRDDAAGFLSVYERNGVLPENPFATLDIDGVGELVALATARGREVRPEIKIGICGEHGGDPASVEFCHRCGLDYISCSPFRVPIARLAAARAAIAESRATASKE